jgi:class 3 adenylate cyclase
VEGGGFFDKEIGDGVIGHFCDEVSSSLDLRGRRNVTLVQSLSVACKIIQCVHGLFKAYRRNLRQGIEVFGPAIGLHNDTAVWLYSKGGIRAIGGSVTDATRLCTNARDEEICVSNSFVQELIGSNAGDEQDILKYFEQRQIKVPEIRSEATPYGYVFKPTDAKLPGWADVQLER